MKDLLHKIANIEFKTEINFSFNLDKEFDLISSCLSNDEQKKLKADFDRFFEKGRFLILNTFSGGILFLKEPEEIQKIIIKSQSLSNDIEASVEFKSESRIPANIKYKPNVGKIESMKWNIELIFPNYFQYQKTIQNALLLIIGKIVKRICEYGRLNFAHMKIENEFLIELFMNEDIKSQIKVEIN